MLRAQPPKKKATLRWLLSSNLAERVGFAYMLQAACARVRAQLQIPHETRAGAFLLCAANKEKSHLAVAFVV